MFDSLKKKFSIAAGKLNNKVSKEAEDENNIKANDEDIEVQKTIEQSIEEEKDEQILESADTLENKQIKETEETLKNKLSKETKEDNKSLDPEEEKVSSSENEEKVEKSKESKFRDKIKLPSFQNSKDDSYEDEDSEFKEDLKTDSEEKIDKAEKDENKEETDGKKKKSGVFSFIREKTISEKDVDDILWELELSLLESDVAIDVANVVVESVKENLVGKKIKRSQDLENYTYEALQSAVSKIIDIKGKSMTKMIEEKKSKGEPLVVMFVGINGTGKTTTIAKIANFYMKKGYTPVVAASDTFRAGAIEQITHHTDNLKIKIIKHQKGSDPAAVAFDAVEHAKAKNKELVLIDTAGRMQTNTNLMDEMRKIKRVAKPDIVVFVGDALTGNDAVEQATKFNDTIDIDGVILTKADADSKGGSSLSIGYVIGKPIMFLGVGQGYDDIKEYDSQWMLEQIFS
ncbi:MAG: signal recognition particle-docking protein FtsY [Methanobrevibacter sp.]|nr:signal recognition particle-docking protein FtsY [Methanobrevibacter sp.]